MDLNSTLFLFFFFPAALLLYYIVPGQKLKNGFLLLAGLVFYALGRWQGMAILLLSALLNWAAGAILSRRKSKPVIAAAVILNIALLVCFKYLTLLTETANGLFSLSLPAWELAVPVGISFFTFKAMSYVIDVYRGGEAGGFFSVLLYVSFFPQVTSGPIARFGQFAGQIKDRTVTAEGAALGLRRFTVGLAKKLLIAGSVAPIADKAFELGGDAGMALAWLGAIAYTVQLYFDFSGYSDMAIGLGRMFGFDTPENFDYPYIATSLRDFWKRWHISLSSWFQDYLYIPLGGGRRGKVRKCLNLLIVFAVSGLWHGAAWTFLLWGLWHGAFSVLENCAASGLKDFQKTAPGRIFGHVYTLILVCLGFVLFRASSPANALGVFRAMFVPVSPVPAAVTALERIAPSAWLALCAGIAGSLPIVPWLRAKISSLGETARSWLTGLSLVGTAALFVVCMLAAAGGNFQPFIYNQF